MSQGQRKYGLADFLSGYFENFGKMLIVNLLYCIPLAIFSGILFAVFYWTGTMNLFGVLLFIPLLSPFTGGLFYICRKLTAKNEIHPWKDFWKGTRENWKFFIINFCCFYVITTGLYITLSYFRGDLNNPIVIFYLILSLLTAVFFLFTEFSMTVMAVSVELKISELLKNSIMLVIGGFWQHLKTLLSLLFVVCVLMSLMAMINHFLIFMIVLGVITLVCLPVLLTYICVYNSYQTIEKTVILPYMEENRKRKAKQEQELSEKTITIEELENLAKGNPEEYVSLRGRMVKRSTVLKMLETKKRNS